MKNLPEKFIKHNNKNKKYSKIKIEKDYREKSHRVYFRECFISRMSFNQYKKYFKFISNDTISISTEFSENIKLEQAGLTGIEDMEKPIVTSIPRMDNYSQNSILCY